LVVRAPAGGVRLETLQAGGDRAVHRDMQRKHTLAGGLKLDEKSLPITDEEPFPLVRRLKPESGRVQIVVPRVMGIAVPPKSDKFGGW
jgi:hypothetical protein